MKEIVVLDAYPINPGDLAWEKLNKLGNVTLYKRTNPEEVVERCKDAEVILTNKVKLDDDILAQLPKLEYVGVMATGYNIINTEAARKRNIVVTNVPAYSTNSVAQLVFAHILNITSQVEVHNELVHHDKWTHSADFTFYATPLIELFDRKIGLIGLGNIGQAVAKIAYGFGMQVFAYTSKATSQLPSYIKKMEMDEIFAECDVVSLHCPLNEQTNQLVNKERINKMKRSAILINTGRGGLIDEEALAQALKHKMLFAAGLDVLSTEPPKEDNPLLHIENCYITPHIAWASHAARKRLVETITNNIGAFIEGKPVNVVN